MFRDVVSSPEGLREHYRDPSPGSLRKQINHLDEHCRAFIAHSPFVVLATSAADGSVDVSPKGGPAAFVVVLDDGHLAIPDLLGNNRLDSLTNLTSNPGVGLLFFIPGRDETLRVNGRAAVVVDDDVLDRCVVMGRRPKTAIGVTVEEAYLHCAKALRRSGIWQPDAWPSQEGLASTACMLTDHIGIEGVTVEDTEKRLEESYRTTMW